MKMKINGRVIVLLCFLLISIGVMISALRWPPKAFLFPIIMGSLVFSMTAAELFFTLFKKGGEAPEAIDLKLSSTGLDKVLRRRRILSIFLWMIGLLFLILLLGFPITIALFTFLYLKFAGKERWVFSLIMTAIIWGSFYILFIWFSGVQFPESWLQKWLGLIMG